ncbi:MAG TPA: pyruvate kinase [Burkholderiales bacterium]|nr:pyruvate kinase [Burkholderiales bacterium]
MLERKRFTEEEITRGLLVERATRGVEQLRRAALAAEEEFGYELGLTAPELRESAYNLIHYLAVRRHDVRPLQDDLSRLGLSSLGRMEAHVLASLNAVLAALYALRGQPVRQEVPATLPINFDTGDAVLAEHANAVLGAGSEGGGTRIMVTMPSEAADDPDLIRDLLAGGMQVARINCAHDSPAVWQRMLEHLRRAERETGHTCRVSFDLAGPKLRTGNIEPGPEVAKWRPERDRLGKVVEPARVRFVAHVDDSEQDEPGIPVEGDIVAEARPGDVIELTDTRDRERSLQVVASRRHECTCETEFTAYVVPGTPLKLVRKGKTVAKGAIGALPPAPQWIALRQGDLLDVVRGDAPGRDAVLDDEGSVLEPATVSCSLPEVFCSVRVGERILFDDGKIGGVIRAASEDRLRVEVASAAGGIAKLRGEKGINLPDSILQLPALTAKDIEDLAFVAQHADLVALSFVQRPEDIEALHAELARLEAPRLGVVLKIETQAAFNRLPSLLLTAMRRPPVAVMVARGDLGVEVGFERLSEVQEEILWLCEAAHVPVIWATQVLESLAKGGLPSRAEVTDAAMASRAECVMLNKGPYIRETLRFLTDVLQRMQSHQQKKTARLRKLQVSDAAQFRAKHDDAQEPSAAAER